MMINKVLGFPAVLFLYAGMCLSCINTQSITYFNNLPDSGVQELQVMQPPIRTLQPSDIIMVKIGGENEETVRFINQYFGGSGGEQGSLVRFQLNSNGEIILPVAGRVKVGGLNNEQAAVVIEQAYLPYLKTPVVAVNTEGFNYTVMGEVKQPGYFTAGIEKINIFEALARAGDMTQNAERQQVKLIRQNLGKREIVNLNFSDRNILNSPYYFLQKDDILYVEPRRTTLISENFTRTASITASLVSVVAILFTIFRQ